MSFKSFPKKNNVEFFESNEYNISRARFNRNSKSRFYGNTFKKWTFVFFETARYPGKRNETRFDRRNVIIRISLIRVTSSSSRRIFHKSRIPVCAFRQEKKKKKKKERKEGRGKKVEAKSRWGGRKKKSNRWCARQRAKLLVKWQLHCFTISKASDEINRPCYGSDIDD